MQLNDKDSPLMWHEVFREAIYNDVKCPQMLSDEGLILSLKCRPVKNDVKGNYWVAFNKAYLLFYLKRMLWNVFRLFPEDVVVELVREAYSFSKDRYLGKEKSTEIDLSSLKTYKLHGNEVIKLEDLRKELGK